MDLCKGLVTKVSKELDEASNGETMLKEFKVWMKDEYVNYMLASKNEFSKTLKHFRKMNTNFTPLVEVLENNIDNYASTQAFFRIGRGEK